MTRNEPAGPARLHRMSDLLGLDVLDVEDRWHGRVGDVRLYGLPARLVVTGLVVTHRQVGSTLGYDRDAHQGPWLVGAVMRRLHRQSALVDWTDVAEVRWGERQVRLRPGARLQHLLP